MPPNNQLPNQTPTAPGPVASAPQTGMFQQPAPAPAKPKNPNSTQSTLQLSEVRDNMVIMTEGSFRAVVQCQSINFDLMSSREREGVEYSYQNFLNALNHPVQILIRSQRIDIGPYIDRLVEMRRDQDNMLLNVLMDDYINYIDALSQEANIMDKTFYIAIPYYPAGDMTNLVEQGKGFFGKVFGKQDPITRIDTATYEKAKTEIKNRVDGVMAGLFQLGIQSKQLNTKELGELYYNFYNPDTAVREPMANFEDVTTTFIKKGTPPTSNPDEQTEVTQ
ncbi:hypothetical protein HGB25_00470 [Candidatus Saccharibacteria bacterium]|nr:hypothetical protein [Candidatus Saccharibacteria bacterium]